MTQEEKELLLIDLCARLPHDVKCDRYGNSYKLVDIDIERGLIYLLRDEQYVPYSILRGDIIKPCLRPMSSMTEDEYYELLSILRVAYETEGSRSIVVYGIQILAEKDNSLQFTGLSIEAIDWLNSHHFDYRGLIEKGLALEAPEDMYKF